MTWKILVTAPYMLPVIDRFSEFFDTHHLEIITAPVQERLGEEELLPLVGDIDGVICGDDRFTDACKGIGDFRDAAQRQLGTIAANRDIACTADVRAEGGVVAMQCFNPQEFPRGLST